MVFLRAINRESAQVDGRLSNALDLRLRTLHVTYEDYQTVASAACFV